MSKMGKISLLVAGLFILASGIIRLVIGTWHDSLYVSLGLTIVFLAMAIFKDHRVYLEFMTMRTTKHGLNMGAMILLALGLLISVNVIAVLNEKKFDWTSEGLNSLSDQSVKAAKSLKSELNVSLLSRKDQQDAAVRRQLQDLVEKYRNENNLIRFTAYDARQRPDLTQKFDFNQGPFGVFIEYQGKTQRVEQISEEEFTRALLKLTREKKKTVYFTEGHGERGISDSGPDGLSFLNEDLITSYDVKTLRLLETPKIPEDAAAVVIAGPQQQFLESELQSLRDYAKNGGRLLIALDPNARHNLAQLTKSLGVEFQANYILDPRAAIPGRGNVAALGLVFSSLSDVTKSFPQGQMTVFQLASAVNRAPDASKELRFDEIIKTDGGPIATNQLTQPLKPSGRGPFTLAISVEGKLAADGKEFAAVVFGDSDFMANELYRQNLNRDLFMNATSYLAKDTDLISIRPKMPKGSALQMTRPQIYMTAIGLLLMTLALFVSGGVVWFRRRSA